MNANKTQKNKKPYIEEETWANFPRAWKIDYATGKISLNELLVLIFLNWEANPHTGLIVTSYDKIAAYFPRNYFKDNRNGVNKIMLKLKQKRYIDYPEHKGSRAGFEVKINGYLLSSGAIKDIFKNSEDGNDEPETENDISEAEVEQEPSRSSVDQDDSGQRSEYKNHQSANEYPSDSEDVESRATNKENEKYNNKNNNKDLSITNKGNFIKGVGKKFTEENPSPYITSFIPKTYEEQKCQKIALWLGEETMEFILNRLSLLGIDKINEAYEITKEAVSRKRSEINRGAYFNSILKGYLEN